MIRNCPVCSNEIFYKSERKFNLAIKNNSYCKSCSKIKINSITEILIRNCQKCNKEIKYKTQISFERAEALDDLCVKCNKIEPKKVFVRKCPICSVELLYKNKYNYYGALQNNSNCINCAAKETASREESKELFKKHHNTKGISIYDIWVKKYGKEEADIRKKIKRKKASEALSGSKNPMYGKPSPNGSGNGWSGHYKNIQFRSLLELFYLKFLLDNEIPFENGEKKKFRVEYEFNGKRSYGLDFYLPLTDEYIEIKPKKLINSPKNKAKFEAAKKEYGEKFKIITEDDLLAISVKDMYDLYLNKELIFDKKYEVKFIEYYQRNIEKGV